MSTAGDPAPQRHPVSVGTVVLGRLVRSYLLQFLVFAAALGVVILLLARAPVGCDCEARTAQVVLFALAALLAVVGTVLQATAAGPAYATSPAEDGSAPGRARTGAVLVGTAVLLVAVAGLVGLW